MAKHPGLKEQLLKELQKDVKDADVQIKDCEERIEVERIASAGITGGPLATSARNACDKRIREYSQKKSELNNNVSWQRSMLEKYQ